MLGNFNSASKSSSMSPHRQCDIKAKDFEEWAVKNIYRSSYHDMYKKSPVKNKNYAIPGYSGHIPGTKADTNYSKRFAVTTRQQFTQKKYLPMRTTQLFPQRPSNLTPMNKTQGLFGGGIPDEYHTISRFHGKSTIPTTHPNYTTSEWTTNYQTEYKKQEELRPEIFRKTDMKFWKDIDVSPRSTTKASGFVQNSTLFDGHGWLPIKELHGNMKYSEYRKRFNPDVNFHPSPLRTNLRSLKKRELVY